MGQLWFAKYNETYHGDENYFFDVKELSIATKLEETFHQFQTELTPLWTNKSSDLRSYVDDQLQYPPNSWSKFVFKVWGIRNSKAYDRFPGLKRLLIEFDDQITSCFISKINAGSQISEHCGETNATLRIHLGLKGCVNDSKVCGIKVGSEIRCWDEGRTLAFLDAHRHQAWNKGDQPRYILIIDIIRPQFKSLKWLVCSRILLNQIYYPIASKFKSEMVFKVPNSIMMFLSVVSLPPLLILSKINERLGFIKV